MATPTSILTFFAKDQVLTPADGAPYEDAIQRWCDNAVKRAKYVVLPRTPEDISRAIRYAVDNSLDLAIKGGGHSTAGASSSDDFVIDLRHFTEIVVDQERSVVEVGGGALWADVDREVGKYGLAVVGGTVNHTGVGGLTLGGGYSWLTGRYGLTIDNLVEVELVLARGDIVTCNAKQNVDLFWAIRGAGSNFGPVTKFTMKMHPQQNTVWSGHIIYHPSKLDEVMKAAEAWRQNAGGSDKESAMVVFAHSPDTGEAVVILVPFYNGPEDEGRKRFEGLLRIEHVADKTNEHPYSEQNTILNASATRGGRKLMRGAHLSSVNLELARYLWDEYISLTTSYSEAKRTVIIHETHPHHVTSSVPPSATAFAQRGPYFNVFFVMQWKDSSLDSTMREWSAERAQHIREVHERAVGKEHAGPAGYANYGLDDKSPEAVFGTNCTRLRELKQKYDRGNVFGKWNPLLPARKAS